MPKVSKKTRKHIKRKRVKVGPDCRRVREEVTCLGDYFTILNSTLTKEDTYWFRGHADLAWRLKPSALRYKIPSKRNRALELLNDFKRFGELKLPKAPSANEEFKWVQLAQHYGLPTRLLDWTRNAAISLYFACEKESEKDGAVFIVNPVDLNREAFPKDARVFDPHQDAKLIRKYLILDGSSNPEGLRTIAINPPWNSERIMLQQGVFTLHGSRHFILTNRQSPSLVYLKIKKEHKAVLLQELERVGVNEMSIFPEAEHMCRYLKWRESLD